MREVKTGLNNTYIQGDLTLSLYPAENVPVALI